MNYLLDSHYLLWAIADSKKISGKIKDIIVQPENKIIVSALSFWEISLKTASGKLELKGFTPEDLLDACSQTGFTIIPLLAEDAISYHQLARAYPKDPFDRMLIWQAIRNDYVLISNDKDIKKYTSEGLKVIG